MCGWISKRKVHQFSGVRVCMCVRALDERVTSQFNVGVSTFKLTSLGLVRRDRAPEKLKSHKFSVECLCVRLNRLKCHGWESPFGLNKREGRQLTVVYLCVHKQTKSPGQFNVGVSMFRFKRESPQYCCVERLWLTCQLLVQVSVSKIQRSSLAFRTSFLHRWPLALLGERRRPAVS